MRSSSFFYHLLAFVPSLTLADPTTVFVEYYPYEVVCSGKTTLSTSSTYVNTSLPYVETFSYSVNSTRIVPGSSSSPGAYTTNIVTANVTAPVFKTGMPTCATCPTPVTEFVPTGFARYGIYTVTQTTDVSTPVYITGTPTCATCSTPVTELVPASVSSSSIPGTYTTTQTTNVTTPVYITGTPTCATCSTPVTELVPSSSTPGTYTTTETANVTSSTFITGKPTCATCSTPVTELVPPTSSAPGVISSKSSSSSSSPSSSPSSSSATQSSSSSMPSSSSSSTWSSSSSSSPNSSSSSSSSPSPTSSSTSSSSSSSSSSSTSSQTPVPSGACSLSKCGLGPLTVQEYNNTYVLANAYAAKDGHSGVGPDYYLDQNLTLLATGSTYNMSVPATYGSGNETYVDGGNGNEVPYWADTRATYGGFEYNPNNFTFVYTGYFVPQQSGSYQFCLDGADNEQAFYIGSNAAFPCGDSSNAATPRGAEPYERYWFASSEYGTADCRNMTLTAGFYYPIRVVYGNDGLPASSQFQVSGPGLGTNMIDLSGYVAPPSCT
ncbi:unnamed protein product [Aureobasidium mustum]|uniref:PA14 domain-containing protein n=1 Tax=Aureobasidium mustum TaxID=2773714 RepID=A0A9N8JU49_9PEZI|nr:unnamed protein product [Aureobasidium mustum]